MEEIIDAKVVVVGGGVVGLASALELQKAGHNTVLVEKNSLLGDEVSSRNSGVVHSGIYYPTGSLKASLTFEGNQLLYSYAKKNNIPINQVGKIIFGKEGDEESIAALLKNGEDNQVLGLSLIDSHDIRILEPNLNKDIKIGIFSKFTGIIDVPELVNSYAKNFEFLGGIITKNSKFLEYQNKSDMHQALIQTGDEKFWLSTENLVLSCGLNSYNVGRNIKPIRSLNSLRNINYSKGHYYKVSGIPPFNHLIYPLPGSHGLGIHYTLDISGAAKFGPDVEFTNQEDYSFSSGSKEKFRNSIKNYWEGVLERELNEDYVGIRPKIQKKDESFADFSFLSEEDHGCRGLLFMQGIESPGLTCSLSIAKFVREKLDL